MVYLTRQSTQHVPQLSYRLHSLHAEVHCVKGHIIIPRPVAQLVEHRVVVREVVSSTPAGPTLRVLK